MFDWLLLTGVVMRTNISTAAATATALRIHDIFITRVSLSSESVSASDSGSDASSVSGEPVTVAFSSSAGFSVMTAVSSSIWGCWGVLTASSSAGVFFTSLGNSKDERA